MCNQIRAGSKTKTKQTKPYQNQNPSQFEVELELNEMEQEVTEKYFFYLKSSSHIWIFFCVCRY